MSRTYRYEKNEGDDEQPLRGAKRRDSQARTSGRSRRGRERRLSVRGERRDQPDLPKIARAVIAMALAEAETDARVSRRNQFAPDEPASSHGGPKT